MNCNPIVNTVRQYCIKNSLRYKSKFTEEGRSGDEIYHCHVLDELLFWVESLLDADFISAASCKEKILSFTVDLNTHSRQYRAPDRQGLEAVYAAKRNFTDFVSSLDEACADVALPYRRTVVDEEKEQIGALLKNKWNFDCNYWIPLSDIAIDDVLYVSKEYIDGYFDSIKEIVFQKSPRVFYYGEGGYDWPSCFETVDLDMGKKHSERAYFQRDASWLIYLSHEETVTFAGSILPGIRALLVDIQDKWNQF